MKKLGIIASLCCAFVLSLALFGCGSGSNGDDPEAAKAAFAGTWNLTGMTQDGQETSADDIKMLAALGLEVYLDLNDDGTAQLMLFGESMDGTWEASSTTAGKVTLNGESVDMTIDGEQLKMEQAEASLTFEKGEARSAAASSASAASTDAAATSDAAASAEAADDAAADDAAADDAAADDAAADEGADADAAADEEAAEE